MNLNNRFSSLLVFGLLTASLSFAGTIGGVFTVNISLNAPDANGLCVSSSLSQRTNALVRVTCLGNQFVSIESRDSRPFVGVHGGAFRYVFSTGTVVPSFLLGDSGGSSGSIGQGTITALRVLDLTERDGKLEFLVSF